MKAAGCIWCKAGRLHRSDYERKPRGCGEKNQTVLRVSFCCALEGCRKRQTPPSLLFLGRRHYEGTIDERSGNERWSHFRFGVIGSLLASPPLPGALKAELARLANLRDVRLGVLTRPQANVADFYRELGHLFNVPFAPHNRWNSARALREKW